MLLLLQLCQKSSFSYFDMFHFISFNPIDTLLHLML